MGTSSIYNGPKGTKKSDTGQPDSLGNSSIGTSTGINCFW